MLVSNVGAEKTAILSENYKRICFEVGEALAKYRKSGEGVRIMGVTKTVDPQLINASIDMGIDLIGENRVQEYLSKKDIYKPCETHFIGHLQSNKIKYIINDVSMIQSVDSDRLAGEINRLAEKNGRVMDILAQINIGNESTKSGVSRGETDELLYRLGEYKNLRLRGLMTIPPPGCDESVFEDMRMLFEEMKMKHGAEGVFDTLSMGMSGDYVLAVKYGSTLIRLGTALYGARKYI